MGRWSALGAVLGFAVLLTGSTMAACGNSSSGNSTFDGGGNADANDETPIMMFGTGSGSSGSSSGGLMNESVCPAGLTCNVKCDGGAMSTSISGTVYDPAGKNPLYGIEVYVPAKPLSALPKGVPTGTDACSCAALYPSGAVVSATTDVNGKFTLTNAPVGTDIPLVLQIGKWRHVVTLSTVTACQDNAQVDKSLALNGTVAPGSMDNMPDIAVSTGSYDSLECLMTRIGIPSSEFVAGTGAVSTDAGAGTGTDGGDAAFDTDGEAGAPYTGHIHIYSGGSPYVLAGTKGGTENHAMPGAPESDLSLWDIQGHLMPYDILLLSCEGAETYMPNPPVLEKYLNAGGRAFASHYHYAWFNGTNPPDWGTNLATWTPGGVVHPAPDDGVIVQTLNGDAGTFYKGQIMSQWLENVGALGQNGVPAGDLSIFSPQYNAIVTAANKPSQPWITDLHNGNNQTMYFSFDTPIGGVELPDGGGTTYCGRAVFSDLHVTGELNEAGMPEDSTNQGVGGQAPPAGCGAGDLTPQEKALEFMLFDLSACVVADTQAPPTMVPTVN
jgi:hypothetical protein